jgi:transcription elongation factor Elf1
MQVISLFQKYLGSSHTLKKDEHAFHCPFCHHHKPKLQINTRTNKFHCWVCNAGGSIIYLAKKIGMSPDDSQELWGESHTKLKSAMSSNKSLNEQFLEMWDSYEDGKDDNNAYLALPPGFTSALDLKNDIFNIEQSHAIAYLKSRGIGKKEIIKYNIGFTTEGLYKDRIIIPSYDRDNRLNYFIARHIHADSKQKYKNPPVSKNIIALENQIDWSEPVTLCEGMFDAISLKRNAIPLFGKFVSKKLDVELKNKVASGELTEISIALDNDAKTDALKIYEKYSKYIPTIKLLDFQEKDAGELKFKDILKYQKNSVTLSFESLIKQKLSFIK